MRETHTQREKERQRHKAEGEAGSMQGAPRGTRSRVSRIAPWTEGSAQLLSHGESPTNILFNEAGTDRARLKVLPHTKKVKI